jgi:hypothetical protein
MRTRIAGNLLLIALITFTFEVFAKITDVRLRICQGQTEEKTITRENLIKIQQFILSQGRRETYCNMYNNNPAYETKNYRFYLNPDTGQGNANCDLKKSGFHNLTIHKVNGGKNQNRTVEFLDKQCVLITANWPTDDLTVQQVRQFVVEAIEEIMSQTTKN